MAVSTSLRVDAALRTGGSSLSHSSTPSLDAQVLLAHVLDRPRSWLFAHGDYVLQPDELSRFKDLLCRREEGAPVAYLREFVEWHGHDYLVNSDVLIPRPETELLLEEAITIVGSMPCRRVADVGTGSGAIAIELALACSGVHVVGVDVSEPALRIARSNAHRLGVAGRLTLLHGNLLDPIDHQPDLIVANLPYLSSDMIASVPIDVTFEPWTALHGGETGLELYEGMLGCMRARGWRIPTLVEIDPRQADAAAELFAEEMPDADVRVLPDLAGHARVVTCLPGERH